jgi:hypothetical protein
VTALCAGIVDQSWLWKVGQHPIRIGDNRYY